MLAYYKRYLRTRIRHDRVAAHTTPAPPGSSPVRQKIKPGCGRPTRAQSPPLDRDTLAPTRPNRRNDAQRSPREKREQHHQPQGHQDAPAGIQRRPELQHMKGFHAHTCGRADKRTSGHGHMWIRWTFGLVILCGHVHKRRTRGLGQRI